MLNMLRIFIGSLFLIVFLGGCAFMDSVSNKFLISLSGSSIIANATPSTSSLVIVQAKAIRHGPMIGTGFIDLFGGQREQTITGGILRNIDVDETKFIYGQTADGLIIFANVPPGNYYLVYIEADEYIAGKPFYFRYNIPLKQINSFIFDTRLGEVKFFGEMLITNTQGEDKSIFELKPSKEAEIAALEKFAQRYNNTSWGNVVQKRIAELKK